MGAHELSVVVEGMTFVESPRWHDGPAVVLRLLHPAGHGGRAGRRARGDRHVRRPAVRDSGGCPTVGLVVVSMRDRRCCDTSRPASSSSTPTSAGVATGHVNDMVVGADGTAYVGNFGFDLMAGAALQTRRAGEGRSGRHGRRVASEPLFFPNGSAITPDGSTLIVSESFGNRMSAFDIAADGTLGPRRDWAALGPPPTTDDLGCRPRRRRCSPPTACASTPTARCGSPTPSPTGSCASPRAGDPRRDPRSDEGCLRLHARRRRRPHAVPLRRTRLPRGRARRHPRGPHPVDDRRHAPRRHP